jgi:rhodanese-related sulfurtransferase
MIMRKLKFWMLSILMASLVLVSCNKTADESMMLAEYLESMDSPVGAGYIAEDMPKIIQALDLQALVGTDDLYLIDIRSKGDYDTLGHIAGAINMTAGEVLGHLDGLGNADSYEKIVIACYSGQTAGWLTSLLRLSGYTNAYSLGWGMSSWNERFAGPWNNGIGNAGDFESTDNPKNEPGAMPPIETGFETEEEILEARISEVLSKGFDGVKLSYATLSVNPDDYYIVNYWSAAEYADPGHIKGAIQYSPKTSLLTTADLSTLPTDKPVVIYCYTGQNSAFCSAYLSVLGYDAKTLLYGANGLIYNDLVAKEMTAWSEGNIKNYPYVLTEE